MVSAAVDRITTTTTTISGSSGSSSSGRLGRRLGVEVDEVDEQLATLGTHEAVPVPRARAAAAAVLTLCTHRQLSDVHQLSTLQCATETELGHIIFVTQRPSDPAIQRPGDPVHPVTLFYNELQMSTYVYGCANRAFYCSSTLSSILSSTRPTDPVTQ